MSSPHIIFKFILLALPQMIGSNSASYVWRGMIVFPVPQQLLMNGGLVGEFPLCALIGQNVSCLVEGKMGHDGGFL